jgi:integrase/recombinase XerD
MDRFHRLDILAAWYREYLTVEGYRPRTIADYCFELSFFRRWVESNTDTADIDELPPELLHDYAASLYDRELAPKTIHHKLAALVSFFGACYEENKLYIDLRRHIQLPRLTKALPAGILTEQEIGRIFDYLETATAARRVRGLSDAVLLRDRAVFEVLYSTGMRRAEVIGLKLCDIGYDEGLVFVRDGKGGKDRVVPIGQKSLEAVRRYVTEARSLLAATDCEHLFVTRRGYLMGDYTIRQGVIKVTQAAGIGRHVKVHTIRHTCATHMLNNGADIRYVQELLGHACLSSTQVYTHVSIAKLKDTHRKYHPREREE